MRMERTRDLVFRLLPGPLTLLAVLAAGLLTIALNLAGQMLLREDQRLAVGVAETIARDVANAVQVGVPINRLVGMRPYLEAASVEGDSIHYIDVKPIGFDISYSIGTLPAGIEAPSGEFSGRSKIVTDGNFSLLSVPIRAANENQGKMIGIVSVGTRVNPLNRFAGGLLLPLMATLIALGLIAAEAIVLLARDGIGAPLRRLKGFARRAQRRDFVFLRTADVRSDEASRLLIASQGIGGRIADAVDDLRSWGAEIKQVQLDSETGRSVDRLLEKVVDVIRVRSGWSEPVARQHGRGQRNGAPYFSLVLANGLAWPLIPGELAQIREDIDWLTTMPIASIATAFHFLAIALGLLLYLEPKSPRRLNQLGYGGALLMIAGLLGCIIFETQYLFCAAWAMSGLGFGMALGCLSGPGCFVVLPERGRMASPALAITLYLWAGVGPLLAGFLEDRVHSNAVFGTAILVAVIGLFLAMPFLRLPTALPHVEKESQAGWTSLGRALIWPAVGALPMRLVLITGLVVVLPLWTLNIGLPFKNFSSNFLVVGCSLAAGALIAGAICRKQPKLSPVLTWLSSIATGLWIILVWHEDWLDVASIESIVILGLLGGIGFASYGFSLPRDLGDAIRERGRRRVIADALIAGAFAMCLGPLLLAAGLLYLPAQDLPLIAGGICLIPLLALLRSCASFVPKDRRSPGWNRGETDPG